MENLGLEIEFRSDLPKGKIFMHPDTYTDEYLPTHPVEEVVDHWGSETTTYKVEA